MNVVVFSVVHPAVEPYLPKFLSSLSSQTDSDFTLYLLSDDFPNIKDFIKRTDLDVRLKNANGEPLDGILYRSSRDHASNAAVIFAEAEHCGPRERERWSAPEPFLLLSNVRYASPDEFRQLRQAE